MKLFFAGTGGGYTRHRRTSCVLFETPKTIFMFDAGSGLESLPKEFNKDKKIVLMISHFHLDHVLGLFALPDLVKPEDVTIFADKNGFEAFVNEIVFGKTKDFYDKIRFVEVVAGENYTENNEYILKTQQLDHFGTTIGYRLEVFGGNIAYCTDSLVCEGSRKLSAKASILIHDTRVLDKDFAPEKKHASVKQAAEMAKEQGVENFFCFHYAPNYSEKELGEMLEEARLAFGEKAFLATDGLKAEI